MEEGGYYVSSTFDITVRLLEKYGWKRLEGCNLTTDNLYGSIPLTKKLLEKKMTFISTMRANRKGLPKELKAVRGREANSTIVWYEKDDGTISIMSYVVKLKSKGMKNILVLSTIPELPSVGVTRDDGKFKSALLKVYDFTKGGTDICDQRKDTYTCNMKSPKETKKILSYMLDETRVNAGTVYSFNHGEDLRKINTFEFIWKLGKQLILPHMRQRRKYGLQSDILAKMALFLPAEGAPGGGDDEVSDRDDHGEDDDDREGDGVFPYDKSRNGKRCHTCIETLPKGAGHKDAKNKLGRPKFKCQVCSKAACEKHLVVACTDCSKKLTIKKVVSRQGSMKDC